MTNSLTKIAAVVGTALVGLSMAACHSTSSTTSASAKTYSWYMTGCSSTETEVSFEVDLTNVTPNVHSYVVMGEVVDSTGSRVAEATAASASLAGEQTDRLNLVGPLSGNQYYAPGTLTCKVLSVLSS